MSFDFETINDAKPVNFISKKKEAKLEVKKDENWVRVNASNYRITLSPSLGKTIFSDSKYLEVKTIETTDKVDKRIRSSKAKKGFTVKKIEQDIDKNYIILIGLDHDDKRKENVYKLSTKVNGKKPEKPTEDNRPIYKSIRLNEEILDDIDSRLTSKVKGIESREFKVISDNIQRDERIIAFDIKDRSNVRMILTKEGKVRKKAREEKKRNMGK